MWVIVLLLAVMVAFWISTSIVHLALTLLVAGFVGWGASKLVLGDRPWGWVESILAGVVGGWVGQLLLGYLGPPIFGVRVIPAFLGAIVVVLVWSLVAGSRRPA